MTLEQTALPPSRGGMTAIAWRDSRRVTWLERQGRGEEAAVALWQYDTSTATRSKLLDPPTPAGEKKPLSIRGAGWNRAGSALLLTGEHDLWLWSPADGSTRSLTNDEAKEEFPTFSPDGSRVAYVKSNDLFVLELASGKESRLTTTGSSHVLNGKLGWVYEEELAHRRNAGAFEWSPDGRSIVYLRLDETRVPEFPIVDFKPVNGKLLPQRYPKAGDPNPVPSVHVVGVEGRGSVEAALPAEDLYVAPTFSWTTDSKAASFLTLDRAQRTVTVRLLPRDGSVGRTLLTESDPAWINAIEPPHFLPDGGFVFVSERSGFFHLYRHGADGTVRNAVTKGEWMVDGPPAYDDAGGRVFFLGTEKDPRERHVYRARLDGGDFARVSQERGVHAFVLSPAGDRLVDTYSNVDTPPTTILAGSDGSRVASLDEAKRELDGADLASTELSSFTGSSGVRFYTRLVKPPGFDPSRRYPVVVFVYGGPHAQVVQDRWGVTSLLDHHLASKGFLVWSMDNRGSWGRGHAFETPLLKRMGEVELMDQLEGIAELKRRPYVDGSRLGIWGWSYGGYMTLYAVTHAPGIFKCAAAGAPVTDWRFYDSIYTERYMKLPKDGPEAYMASAPLSSAGSLDTQLLILHGTSDDNVHMQNSMDFVDELVRARKEFVFVPLPGQNHLPRGPALLYRNQRIAEWFERILTP